MKRGRLVGCWCITRCTQFTGDTAIYVRNFFTSLVCQKRMFVGRNGMFNRFVVQGWFYRVSQGAGKRSDLNITRQNSPPRNKACKSNAIYQLKSIEFSYQYLRVWTWGSRWISGWTARGFSKRWHNKTFSLKTKKVNVINFGRSAFEHFTKSLPKIISLTWRKITSTFHKRL